MTTRTSRGEMHAPRVGVGAQLGDLRKLLQHGHGGRGSKRVARGPAGDPCLPFRVRRAPVPCRARAPARTRGTATAPSSVHRLITQPNRVGRPGPSRTPRSIHPPFIYFDVAQLGGFRTSTAVRVARHFQADPFWANQNRMLYVVLYLLRQVG
jgi:hypothetical protein